VAGIVKLDDLGLWLSRRPGAMAQALGRGIVGLAPWLMKALSVAGTVAMFLVGGGILVHGLPALHHAILDACKGWAAWRRPCCPPWPTACWAGGRGGGAGRGDAWCSACVAAPAGAH
jgi:predicted DNA repair protein MutK